MYCKFYYLYCNYIISIISYQNVVVKTNNNNNYYLFIFKCWGDFD